MLAIISTAPADQFVMQDGQRIEGVLLNPDEEPRATFQVRTVEGNHLALSAKDVTKHIPDSPQRLRYLELLPRMPQTPEGNWAMAEWCLRAKLSTERTFHLEEVLRLDPAHEPARRALGHLLIDGEWVEREEVMLQRGFLRHKGRWRLPQEVELQAAREAEEQAINQWRRTLSVWRRGLDNPNRSQDAWDNISSISDPMAAPILIAQLEGEANEQVRLLYVDVLSCLDSPMVGPALTRLALMDPSRDVRRKSVEKMPVSYHNAAIDTFIAALRTTDKKSSVARIRHAGEALQILSAPRAIPQLIEALVTVHRVKVGEENPGQIGLSFGGSGNPVSGLDGFSVGGSARVEQHTLRHREVLDALLAVSNGANFRFDQLAWQQWYLEQKTPVEIDLRRGN